RPHGLVSGSVCSSAPPAGRDRNRLRERSAITPDAKRAPNRGRASSLAGRPDKRAFPGAAECGSAALRLVLLRVLEGDDDVEASSRGITRRAGRCALDDCLANLEHE